MLGRSVAAMVAAVALAAPAVAQAPMGPEFRVNSYTTSEQRMPAVSGDADGNFVVVWQSISQDGSAEGVFGQRLDRLGQSRGAEFAVNTYTTADQMEPAVAVDASGRFVVVWESSIQDGSGFGVFARRYDALGIPLGLSEFRVNAQVTSHQRRPDVAYAADGTFVVVWDSLGQDGDGYGIFGRRFDASGGALGAEFLVNLVTTGAQTWPAVAINADGSFVVAWTGGGTPRIFARRFDASASPLGPEFQVNSYITGFQASPDVAVDATGRFVVVWSLYAGDGSRYGVSGRRFDANGNPLGLDFTVNVHLPDDQRMPSVVRDPSGPFVVMWQSYAQDGANDGIFARRFDASGGAMGDEFRINEYTTGAQARPALASLGAERFVVAWQSYGQDGGLHGVFAHRFGDLLFRDGFDSGGTSRWSAASTDGGDLSVTTDAALNFTTFGLQAQVDDTNGLYVQDDTPKDETTYRARFYFHPGDFDPGESQAHFRTRIAIAFEEAPTRRLMALVLRRQGGQYSLMGRARRDDNTQSNTGFLPITASAHTVEVRWVRASAPGAEDGIFAMWIDGDLKALQTTLDNDVSTVDFVRLGALSVKTGAAGTLYFDEFESRRETYVGP